MSTQLYIYKWKASVDFFYSILELWTHWVPITSPAIAFWRNYTCEPFSNTNQTTIVFYSLGFTASTRIGDPSSCSFPCHEILILDSWKTLWSFVGGMEAFKSRKKVLIPSVLKFTIIAQSPMQDTLQISRYRLLNYV